MTDVLPVMLLVGAIAGVISFGVVQSLVRIFPRGRQPAVERIERRAPQRMRTATLQ
ncbi:MAG TPA: hypothetical protein VFU21_04485 [Kofleriaceae bacterium]|nr:hypothetical protein [Kofleriaceae bacterium]